MTNDAPGLLTRLRGQLDDIGDGDLIVNYGLAKVLNQLEAELDKPLIVPKPCTHNRINTKKAECELCGTPMVKGHEGRGPWEPAEAALAGPVATEPVLTSLQIVRDAVCDRALNIKLDIYTDAVLALTTLEAVVPLILERPLGSLKPSGREPTPADVAAGQSAGGECTCAERGCDMAGDCGGSCGCNESGHAQPATEPVCGFVWADGTPCKTPLADHADTSGDHRFVFLPATEPVCECGHAEMGHGQDSKAQGGRDVCFMCRGFTDDWNEPKLYHEFQPAESGGA